MTLRVGIYVFPEVEVLDFAGPYEVFTTASRVFGRRNPGQAAPFEVFTVAAKRDPIKARAGLPILPEFDFRHAPPIDVLVVPGGVVSAELDQPTVIEWIARDAAQRVLTASVCTGAFLLAAAGLLDGASVTTHWEDIDDLSRRFPHLKVVADQRWIDNGRTVTSGGISAGIDMSLHLVGRLADKDLAVATARQMDYPWQERDG
ncbi:MAG: DJ-1/PfpI family protein [Rhodocyclales bacterium GT-UBC]|nr:MAG: DJ-1/PfpI family protein [Rhodocyclales bacterium GT-UBC]